MKKLILSFFVCASLASAAYVPYNPSNKRLLDDLEIPTGKIFYIRGTLDASGATLIGLTTGGNSQLFGAGLPAGGTGAIGDTYYRTDTPYGLYKKTGASTWTLQVTLWDAAKIAAEDAIVLATAAADATAKANSAQSAATAAAATDATTKANAAQAAAISTASTDATAKANAAQAAAIQRANHTGTQSADTLTDGTTNKAFLATERTKLAGIATGATANSPDATLLARANHTGTQALSTLAQSGATTGQVVKWNGTAWVPDTDNTGGGGGGSGVKTTWVSRDNGSDVTGTVGNILLPFATIKAAHDACVTATGQWMINVQPSSGVYTDVGMSSANCSYYFEPGARLSNLSGNVDCFPISSGTADSWGIYGYGTFIVNSTGTGCIVNHTGGTIGTMTWEGISVNVLASGGSSQTGAFRTFSTLTGPNNGNLTIKFANASSSANMASLYLRSNKCFIEGGLYTFVTIDGNSDIKAFIDEAHKWSIGPNAFGSPNVRLTTNRGMKGSDGGPAIIVRTGTVLIRGGCVYSGGGPPSGSQATILEITSQSSGEAATTKVIFSGCTLVNWGNGASSALSSGSGPMIRFPAFAGAQVTLVGCHMDSGTINATTAMVTSTGGVPQNLYIGGGGLTSNVGVSSDITLVGAPFTVDASFPNVIDFP